MHIIKVEISTPENDMKYATDLEIQITGGSVAVYVREGLCSWLGSGVLLGLMGVLVSLPGSELAKPI